MVRSTAACASATTRSRTTRMSSVSAAAALPAAAASRTTVRMVPSVGFITARYATAAASLSARATPRASNALPLRHALREAAEDLREDHAAVPAGAHERSVRRGGEHRVRRRSASGRRAASSTAERSVRYMFEPVSPSGTGKTLRSLISCWLASSQESAAVRPAEDLLAADLAKRLAEHRQLRRRLSGGHRHSPRGCPGRSRSPRPPAARGSSRPSSSPRS